MNPSASHQRLAAFALDRRAVLKTVGGGVFAAALSELEALGKDARSGEPYADTLPRPPHHRPQAKAMIHLFMNGGPSQMDLFDPKPELDRRHGEAYFEAIAGEVEFPEAAGALMRSPFKFARHGECGMDVSDAMPHLAKRVDDIAFLRSMYTSNLTHEPAIYKIQSGSEFIGRPTLGAWITYGLGSENQNLPAYVVLDDPLGLPVNGIDNWTSGFLPPMFQGTRFRATGSPVLNLRSATPQPDSVRSLQRALTRRLDAMHRDAHPDQPQLAARMASYELAARMQLEASDALDLSQESKATHRRYGLDNKTTESYGRRCLIARRLIERGVRFVQLYINSQIWDNHNKIAATLRDACNRTDLPIAGLLEDLKIRGLLDETLVVWGGEMGRLPIAQLPADKNAALAGRDHNKNAICTWMAGGGVKPGLCLGATDELGFAAVENRISVADWHATILHLLGIHYERLTLQRNGFQERLTGVEHPRIIRELIA